MIDKVAERVQFPALNINQLRLPYLISLYLGVWILLIIVVKPKEFVCKMRRRYYLLVRTRRYAWGKLDFPQFRD